MRRVSVVLLLLVLLMSCSVAVGQTVQSYTLPNGQPGFIAYDLTGKGWHSASQYDAWYAAREANKVVSYRKDEMTSPPTSTVARPEDNQGVVVSQIPQAPPQGQVWGTAASSWRASEMNGPVQPDVFLSLYGSKAEATLQSWKEDPDFQGLLNSMGSRVGVKAYPASYATNKGLGYEDGGSPDILI